MLIDATEPSTPAKDRREMSKTRKWTFVVLALLHLLVALLRFSFWYEHREAAPAPAVVVTTLAPGCPYPGASFVACDGVQSPAMTSAH